MKKIVISAVAASFLATPALANDTISSKLSTAITKTYQAIEVFNPNMATADLDAKFGVLVDQANNHASVAYKTVEVETSGSFFGGADPFSIGFSGGITESSEPGTTYEVVLETQAGYEMVDFGIAAANVQSSIQTTIFGANYDATKTDYTLSGLTAATMGGAVHDKLAAVDSAITALNNTGQAFNNGTASYADIQAAVDTVNTHVDSFNTAASSFHTITSNADYTALTSGEALTVPEWVNDTDDNADYNLYSTTSFNVEHYKGVALD